MQECYMASVSAHFIKYLCAQKMGIEIGVEEKYICYVSLSLFVCLSHLLCLAPLFTFELIV